MVLLLFSSFLLYILLLGLALLGLIVDLLLLILFLHSLFILLFYFRIVLWVLVLHFLLLLFSWLALHIIFIIQFLSHEILLRNSQIKDNSTTFEISAIEFFHSLEALILISHLNKSKSPAYISVWMFRNINLFDLSKWWY